MTTRIEIVRGLSMPFFPMRPTTGSRIHNSISAKRLLAQVASGTYVMQPKLGGDRASLAVHEDRVLVQNRHGGWYGHPVHNKADFLKLGNGVVFDGEVFEGAFYPFEALAYDKRSLLRASAAEREVLAVSLVRLLGHPWLFNTPAQAWLNKRKQHGKKWEGVVMKRAISPYVVAASDTATNLHWFKHLW